jgi:hypothetical protein
METIFGNFFSFVRKDYQEESKSHSQPVMGAEHGKVSSSIPELHPKEFQGATGAMV